MASPRTASTTPTDTSNGATNGAATGAPATKPKKERAVLTVSTAAKRVVSIIDNKALSKSDRLTVLAQSCIQMGYIDEVSKFLAAAAQAKTAAASPSAS